MPPQTTRATTLASSITKTLLTAILLVSSFGALKIAAAADAATVDSSALAEVVVTATRREENVQRVPISMAVLSAEELREKNIETLTDITESVPNLAFATNNDLQSSTSFTIRGLTTTDNNTGISPGVGIYVDGVYLARNMAFDAAVNDAQRIEVLLGPQGTQFGRNATQGAISITTIDPTTTLHADAQVQAGNYDLIDTRARVSGPIADNLLGLVSFYYHDRDGLVDDPAQGTRLNAEHYYGGRAKLLFTPRDDLELRLTVDGQRDDTSANTLSQIPITFNTNTNGLFNGQPEFFYRNEGGVALDLRYRLSNNTQLVSTSAYRQFNSNFGNDQDFTTTQVIDFAGRNEGGHWFTQEFRLASPADQTLSYVAGLFFLSQTNDTTTHAAFGAAFPLSNTNVSAITAQRVTSYAAFGNLTYAFASDWRLTGGLRVTADRQTLDFTQVSTVLPVIPNIPTTPESINNTEASPLATLTYQVTPDVMAYATYSKGFKAGGFNTTFVFNSDQVVQLKPEFVSNYELGVKSQMLDGRLQANLTGFYEKYTDQQVSVFVSPVIGFSFRNAATTDVKGVELELKARPMQRLLLAASLGYNDAKYAEFPDCGGAGVNCSDNQVPTPRLNASASAQYDQPIAAGTSMRFRIDGYHENRAYTDSENTLISTDKNILNAKISLLMFDEKLSVSLWGANLTNDWYREPSESAFIANQLLTPYPNPRTYGVSLAAKY